MEPLKEQFIDKLKKFKKAMDYMDSEADTAEKEKHQKRFCSMLADLNKMECQLRQSGYTMPDEEISRMIENM